jgi:hypothetical protein
MVVRMLCYRSGKCIGLAIEEMMLPMKVRCSGGVAMDWHQRMESVLQRLASMVEGIAVKC